MNSTLIFEPLALSHAGDWMKNYDDIITPMLDAGLRVMIYAGVEDLICNW